MTIFISLVSATIRLQFFIIASLDFILLALFFLHRNHARETELLRLELSNITIKNISPSSLLCNYEFNDRISILMLSKPNYAISEFLFITFNIKSLKLSEVSFHELRGEIQFKFVLSIDMHTLSLN